MSDQIERPITREALHSLLEDLLAGRVAWPRSFGEYLVRSLEARGLCVAPVEATHEMELAARDFAIRHRFPSEGALYAAMLRASPLTPSPA